jgi:hypothetical protein
VVTLYATRQDVRDVFEGTIPDDTRNHTRLDVLLTRASAKLAAKVPSLDRRMAAGQVDPEVPAGMVVEAVLRVWRNPAGLTQQGVGPFQASYNNRAQQNEIIFDQEEIDQLLGESAPIGTFRVAYPGRQMPLEPSVDAQGVSHVVIHPAGV